MASNVAVRLSARARQHVESANAAQNFNHVPATANEPEGQNYHDPYGLAAALASKGSKALPFVISLEDNDDDDVADRRDAVWADRKQNTST